jgi:cysteine desulfurase family protein (TIGR01976 family)
LQCAENDCDCGAIENDEQDVCFMGSTDYDVEWVRSRFPALSKPVNGRPPIFFDGPGGTQVCRHCIDATMDYFENRCANGGGTFETSLRTDETARDARSAMADLLNAPGPDNIVFGANMTTLTLHLARSLADTIEPGDEIVVTNLDHDANVTPWTDLERRGAAIRVADIDPADCTLDPSAFDSLLSERTRLVAVTHASNAVGTVPDVAEIVRRSHAAGALVFVDAVQYVPHGPVDVQALDCDFLACSAYKFFGPHVGVLYGKAEHLDRLTPCKVRPAPSAAPGRWETGTPNYEGLAGVGGAVRHFEEIGERFGGTLGAADGGSAYAGRRLALKRSMAAIHRYESSLARALLDALEPIPGLRIFGITDRSRLDERGATVAFTMNGRAPREIAAALAARGIYCWSGNYYALRLMERLGLEPNGAVRVGLTHYNTVQEIEQLREALCEIQARQ